MFFCQTTLFYFLRKKVLLVSQGVLTRGLLSHRVYPKYININRQIDKVSCDVDAHLSWDPKSFQNFCITAQGRTDFMNWRVDVHQ